jgi:hypothetical protein
VEIIAPNSKNEGNAVLEDEKGRPVHYHFSLIEMKYWLWKVLSAKRETALCAINTFINGTARGWLNANGRYSHRLDVLRSFAV